ncbi:MAG: hydroxyethylthiazole kinase [Alsobacter sp.]
MSHPADPPPATPADVLAAIRRRRPLVHNITNAVVMNSTANGLLAIGASPVMAHAPEEVAEVTTIASALVINLGTLTREQVAAMDISAAVARDRGVPWVLDPVGVGVTALRRSTAERLLLQKPSVVRGNASEIGTLAGEGASGRGVDSTAEGVFAGHEPARHLARRLGCVVAVTGVVDLVTDGRQDVLVHNGHAMLANVTGTGCLATALVGAALGTGARPLEAAAAALVVLGLAGEQAAAGEVGPGTMQVRLLDRLAALSPEDVAEGQRVS